MNRWHLLATALALFSAAGTAQAATSSVDYTVTPVISGTDLTAITVDVAFSGDRSGRTRLELPDHWAEAQDLWRRLEGLQVTGATIGGGSGAMRTLVHPPGAPIHVRYRIPLGAEPGRDHTKGEPVVRPGWFMIHGEALLALPGGREARPARFHWGAYPSGWTLASDLEHSGGHVANLPEVSDSVLVGARQAKDVRRRVGRGSLRVVVIGDWPFQAEAFADATARVMAAENRFWRDRGHDFLITVTPLGPATGGGLSMTGSGKGDAFAVESTTNVDLTKDPHFLAHEYMHTWIPLKVGGFAEQAEARDYWFSEGFTDFYGTRVLLRAGVWSLEDVAGRYNEVLARYGASPVRNLTADEVMARFWTDDAAAQSPYDRGRLLATLWDRRIREASAGKLSLDDVLRRQQALARRPAKGMTAASLFPAALAAVAPDVDARGDLDRYIIRGETIRLPADVFAGCLTVADVTVAAFDPGFDAQKSGETGIITGVDPAGPAYAAGLRDGMKRIAREGGRNGDSRVEIGYRVAGPDGVERVIRWRPEGRPRVTFQQVTVPALTPQRRAACDQLLGGS